jgi:hypothetical protein
MQSQFIQHQPMEAIFHPGSSGMDVEDVLVEVPNQAEPVRFHGHFQDCMEMYANAITVEKYLDAHQDWFCRSAHPMKVESLGVNSYALSVGRYGAFGHEVEPKVGLELLPQEQRVYRIKTVPIPNYVAPGYDVDFNAALELVETAVENSNCSAVMTKVEWQLDLVVDMYFPKFIRKLPKGVIQTTGDRLLAQIVRQVSHRLTRKVQQDFYQSLGIPVPKKIKCW